MYSLILTALLALNVESTIDSVVVYTDQAMVVRKAIVTVSGSGQLEFADLPGILDDNSVRIRAEGLKIGEVQVKPGYLAEPAEPGEAPAPTPSSWAGRSKSRRN